MLDEDTITAGGEGVGQRDINYPDTSLQLLILLPKMKETVFQEKRM